MPDFAVGDEVIVNISTDPEFHFISVNDRYRVPTLALLLVLFAVAVTVVGGWRGVRSVIALALTLGRGRQARGAADPGRLGPGLGRDRLRPSA